MDVSWGHRTASSVPIKGGVLISGVVLYTSLCSRDHMIKGSVVISVVALYTTLYSWDHALMSRLSSLQGYVHAQCYLYSAKHEYYYLHFICCTCTHCTMIRPGFQIDSELLNGRNALHYAADYGQAEVIKYLIGKGT